MQNRTREHDIKTFVKLLVPREVSIRLVPLEIIEQSRSNLFWASIFFGILCSILGSLISLLTSNNQNESVVYLLILFLSLFILLFVIFAYRGNLEYKRAISQGYEKSVASEERPMKFSNRDIEWIGLAYKAKNLLQVKVFKAQTTLEEDVFTERVLKTFPLKNAEVEIVDFIKAASGQGLISKIKKNGLSSAGEFHPHALQEPYVTVSCHTAPTAQPTAENQIPKTQIVRVHGVQCDLTSGSL